MDEIETIDRTVPAFSYQLLRDVLIPELLGNDQATILYWAGKNLSRRFPLESTEEFVDFFTRAGWGTLSIEAESKTSITFLLKPEWIEVRLKENKHVLFTLEAGFLAQQVQMLKNRFADAQSSVKKGREVSIIVQWDQKDEVNEETARSRSSRS